MRKALPPMASIAKDYLQHIKPRRSCAVPLKGDPLLPKLALQRGHPRPRQMLNGVPSGVASSIRWTQLLLQTKQLDKPPLMWCHCGHPAAAVVAAASVATVARAASSSSLLEAVPW